MSSSSTIAETVGFANDVRRATSVRASGPGAADRVEHHRPVVRAHHLTVDFRPRYHDRTLV